MKYIYDIVLNFNKELYEFYEWNEDDFIEYIKKIPMYKVSNKMLNDVLKYKIVVSNKFIKDIYNKTEVYMNKGIGKLEYTCLFCTDEKVIGLEFDEKGKLLFKSDLLLDEEIDTLNYSKNMTQVIIDYKVIKQKYNCKFITRREIKINEFIDKELEYIYKNKNIDKLKYLYYECFENNNNSISKMKIDLKKCDNKNKLYDLLMISYLKK